MEIDQLRCKDFGDCLNTQFVVADGGAALELVSVTEIVNTERQENFSLLFRGPLEPFLAQRTYVLEHERLGKLPMFLVPVGRDAKGYDYEAVFNRLRRAESAAR